MASKRKINEVCNEPEKVGKTREIGWRLQSLGLEYILNEEKIQELKPASYITNITDFLSKYFTVCMNEDD
jgi:hypothetical protein